MDQRLVEVRRFFATSNSAEAVAIARKLGANYVALYGSEQLNFDFDGVLLPMIELPNVRIYRIASPGNP